MLTRLCGKTLDVSPLPFGVKSVNCQAALAGTTDTGQDSELVERDVDIDAAQIMNVNSAESDRRSRIPGFRRWTGVVHEGSAMKDVLIPSDSDREVSRFELRIHLTR